MAAASQRVHETGQPGVAAQWLTNAVKARPDADGYWQLAQIYQDTNDSRLESALRDAVWNSHETRP